jgi:PleD family two-component response regulator
VDFNLPSLISCISEIISIRAEDKGINFYLESTDELPNGVHGDERRLRQILLNLLGIIGVKGEAPKILVVDDNEYNQAVMVDLLSRLGFNVELANNGCQGLEKKSHKMATRCDYYRFNQGKNGRL